MQGKRPRCSVSHGDSHTGSAVNRSLAQIPLLTPAGRVTSGKSHNLSGLSGLVCKMGTVTTPTSCGKMEMMACQTPHTGPAHRPQNVEQDPFCTPTPIPGSAGLSSFLITQQPESCPKVPQDKTTPAPLLTWEM